MNMPVSHEPESMPPNAIAFAGAESLFTRLKGDKVMAIALAPLGLACAGLAVAFLIYGLVEAKSAGDYFAIFLMSLLGALPVFGCTYPLWQLYDSARKMQVLAPPYKDRAIVVTQDYLEIFTGALEEHERCYYAKRAIPVVRVPWNTISSFTVGRYRSGKHSHTRGYVIKSESVPERFSGQIRVMSVHFEANEDAILQAIAPRMRVPV